MQRADVYHAASASLPNRVSKSRSKQVVTARQSRPGRKQPLRALFRRHGYGGQGREDFSMLRSSLLAALLLVGISGTLAAQKPTEEQRAAIRSACRADFTANCSGVSLAPRRP
jgi:cephalosporin-C deacetylase-like acetyl esterase